MRRTLFLSILSAGIALAVIFTIFSDKLFVAGFNFFTDYTLDMESWDISFSGKNTFSNLSFFSNRMPFLFRAETLYLDIENIQLWPGEIEMVAKVYLENFSLEEKKTDKERKKDPLLPVLTEGEVYDISFVFILSGKDFGINELEAVSEHIIINADLEYFSREKSVATDIVFLLSPEKSKKLPKGLVSSIFYPTENGWNRTEIGTSFKIR